MQVRIALTGNYQTGNVEIINLRGRLDFTASSGQNWVFKSQNASLYQEFYSVRADNDLFSRNYVYFRPHGQVYPFAIAYISKNYRRQIDFSYFAGGGLTVQLWRTRQNVIKLSAGGVYESTRFMGSTFNSERYNGSQTMVLGRVTTWLGGWHYLLDNRLRLYYDAFWQPAFSDATNYRWQFDVGVDFPIWRGLNLNVAYTYTHENIVILKVRRDDKLLTVGLSYNLRKNRVH
ncbi:hypothetical protein GCM10023187_36530 [Nibrella viscosa]|uniref:DUF481 domain-containing protein n=1 Tax=Nibrella viscosa TaxID=1084524 RepID=A0ABP8KMQ9_9BACT